jgi:BlaI family penicillinase repressor
MRRPAPPRDIPPPLELECLKVLWKIGEANVKQVQEALADRKPLAYTTVMTLLDRLVRRGSATRRKAGRFFVYSPAVSREKLQAAAVAELINSFFEGSVEQLLAYLQGAPVPLAKPEQASEPRSAEETLDTALL